MKLRVKKVVNEGRVNFDVKIDNESPTYQTIREITGHTGETHRIESSPFINCVNYGNHSLTGNAFPRLVDNDTAMERADKIIKRLKIIYNFVQECKKRDELESGMVEITIPDFSSYNSKKRDKKGQFCKA